MIFIVILEPLIKLCYDRFCIGSIMNINIIPLEGFDEGFGHTIGLRASDGGKTADEAHILPKSNRFSGGVTAAVVAEPFHGVWEPYCRAEAALNRFNHQIPHPLAANAASGGNMADDFAIAAIQGKGNPHHLSVPAGNLEAIRTPAQVGTQADDLAFVRQHSLFARMPGQQQPILAHDAIDPLVIDGRPAHLIQFAVKQRTNPSVSVSRAIIHKRRFILAFRSNSNIITNHYHSLSQRGSIMSSIADSIMEASSRSLEADGDQSPHKFVMLNRIRSIDSDALFSDGDQVFIQHRGEQYLLRRTRNGKLILTK